MLRIKNLSNKYQKRLIRPLYAQTQATPYAAVLASNVQTAHDTGVWTGVGSGAPFVYKNGLVPGTVMVAKGDTVDVATGAVATGPAVTQRPFGLLANFVGGDLDDLGDNGYVGVWRGPDSVYEILAPGFVDTSLAAAWNASTVGVPVPLYAGADGRLSSVADLSGGTVNGAGNVARQVVAYLIERPNQNRIIVDLVI